MLAFVVGTIVLIDDNGVLNIVENDVFIENVGELAGRRRCPCFDPEAIRSVGESAIPDSDSIHVFFIFIFSQASNANAMPRTTVDLTDVNVGGSRPKWNAIVPSPNI